MPAVPLHLRGPAAELAAGFDAIRAELGISDTFPPDVLAEVDEVVRRGPSAETDTVVDLRDVPFLTIDPPGAMDLDQALALERAPGGGGGYVFRYAIADVAAFVAAGGAIDAEARRRGVTVYLPDRNAPLHPPALSEGAASLLPDVERQALVWTIRLDGDAAPTDVRVERARVRSRGRFTYEEAQARVDTDEPLTLLREIGRLREAAEVARGGVSLPLPDQQVSEEGGRYRLEFRAPLPTEGWNAQLSLLAGMCAADLMVTGGVGVLRTLPPPADSTIDTLRLRARALDVEWPADADYAAVVRALDPAVPRQAALLASAARLFRGAGYLAFDGEAPDGAAGVHAAVAAHYAHVTAPLRRLVDRFGNEIVLALCAGVEPPAWARDALDELPALMAEARRREGSAAGMALDLVEAVVLGGCDGEELRGVVTNTSKGRAMVQVVDPAVVASVDDPKGHLEPGQAVRLRVGGTDVAKRSVDLEVLPPAAHQS